MHKFFITSLIVLGGVVLFSDTAYASMPQLDTKSYAGQLLWLFVSFCTMYFLMARFALPHVRNILDRREEVIHGNLEQASQAKLTAEDIKISYDNALRQADQKADDYLKKEAEKLAKSYADDLKKANDRILVKIQKAEKMLENQMADMNSDIEETAEKIAHEIVSNMVNKSSRKTGKTRA